MPEKPLRFDRARFRSRLLFPIILAVTCSARAEIVRIDGHDLFLDAPPGFVKAANFAGLQQIQTSSSIEVQEFGSSFETIVTALSPDVLVLEGILVVEQNRIESGGRPALLQLLEQDIAGIPFNKWQLVIGDRLRSVVVTASFPAWAAEQMSAPLKASLLSASWMRSAEEQLFHDLPFTLSQTDDLKVVKRTQNMVVLADISDTGTLTGRSPSIVVGYLTAEEELVDRPAISHRQLASVKSIEDVEILEEGATTVDGIGAYVIKAKARRKNTRENIDFKQTLVFQPRKFMLVQSAVEPPLAARYAPQFEAVVASIRFKATR